MAGFAARQFSRMRRLAHLLAHQPDYVLGRLATVRDAYSTIHAVKDAIAGAASLKIHDLYGETMAALDIAPSGYLRQETSAVGQVDDMRKRSFSLGPYLNADAVSLIQEAAHSLPLELRGAGKAKTCRTYAEFSASPELRDWTAIATVIDSSTLPVIRALAGDPAVYETARRFLGYRPRQVSTWLFWSLANRLSEDQRRGAYQTIDFHYDIDGYNFMYANFYLLETGPSNGAHVLIEGTSRRKRLRDLVGSARLSDSEARQAYGQGRERLMAGPAGFGFVEDASCYHKALPPQDSDRLMLQLRYR